MCVCFVIHVVLFLLWQVMEGMEMLEEINSQFCDDNGRPYRDIRILHTYVLDDPFDDPPQVRQNATDVTVPITVLYQVLQ